MKDSNEQSGMRADGTDRKPYTKPTLTKGPVLSKITAEDSVSVAKDDIVDS